LLDVQRRINASGYPTLHAFLSDIDLIVANCQAFTDAAGGGQRLMNRACAMQDTVMIMCTQLDRGLVAQCAAIEEKRLYVSFSLQHHRFCIFKLNYFDFQSVGRFFDFR
jgi:hypothetical protein